MLLFLHHSVTASAEGIAAGPHHASGAWQSPGLPALPRFQQSPVNLRHYTAASRSRGRPGSLPRGAAHVELWGWHWHRGELADPTLLTATSTSVTSTSAITRAGASGTGALTPSW